MISFINFGYLKVNIRNIFGYPNLIKRLQSPFLFNYLNPLPNEMILDYGCGAGFFSAEIAKKKARVYALDVSNNLDINNIDNTKINYCLIKPNKKLPFKENYFDKILISEVLMALDNRKFVVREMKRILKPGGLIYCLNFEKSNLIKFLYNKKLFLLFLKVFFSNFPNNYDQYWKKNLASQDVFYDKFPSKNEIKDLFMKSKLNIISQMNICKGIGLELIYLIQFFKFLKKKNFNNSFFMYLFFASINFILPVRDRSSVLTIVKKND